MMAGDNVEDIGGHGDVQKEIEEFGHKATAERERGRQRQAAAQAQRLREHRARARLQSPDVFITGDGAFLNAPMVNRVLGSGIANGEGIGGTVFARAPVRRRDIDEEGRLSGRVCHSDCIHGADLAVLARTGALGPARVGKLIVATAQTEEDLSEPPPGLQMSGHQVVHPWTTKVLRSGPTERFNVARGELSTVTRNNPRRIWRDDAQRLHAWAAVDPAEPWRSGLLQDAVEALPLEIGLDGGRNVLLTIRRLPEENDEEGK
jgi:hypothetical protein